MELINWDHALDKTDGSHVYTFEYITKLPRSVYFDGDPKSIAPSAVSFGLNIMLFLSKMSTSSTAGSLKNIFGSVCAMS